MNLVPEGQTHPRGEAMFHELLYIHNLLRQHLHAIMVFSEDIIMGATPAEIASRVHELKSTSLIWKIRVNCMQYCQFVHGHHQHEDHLWFPILRDMNPSIGDIIDKLEADHVIVAQLLGQVEGAAHRIIEEESARGELLTALGALAEHLLTHLDYEETHLAPTLKRIQVWH